MIITTTVAHVHIDLGLSKTIHLIKAECVDYFTMCSRALQERILDRVPILMPARKSWKL